MVDILLAAIVASFALGYVTCYWIDRLSILD